MNAKAALILALACLGSCVLPLQAQVVINEFQYDDAGTDDREYIELFNSGTTAIDISGWRVTGADPEGLNAAVTIPASTTLAAGAFYVIGNAGVANVNQTVAAGFLENDNESIELYDATNALRDALIYEANRGISAITGFASIQSQVGPGYWANHNTSDVAGTPLRPFTSVGRHLDGRDTNNNGRDFGLKPATPGAANNPDGVMTQYTPPRVDSLADGSVVAGLSGSFVNARAFTPGTVVAGLNPNPIPAPAGAAKAITAWDGSGGGNGTASNAAFANGGRFDLQVYLDTTNLPASTNAAGVPFRGSEQTFFGIGGGDALANLTDVSGTVFSGAGTASANGSTGVAWYYEKVAEGISEKLYLIDANDGGQGNVNATGFDWIVLATIDLSLTDSGWYELSLSVLPDGSGSARFDNQVFNFTTIPNLTGEFYVSYRENTQDGSVTVPSYLRPATFAPIPELTVAVLLGLAALSAGLSRRRRQS